MPNAVEQGSWRRIGPRIHGVSTLDVPIGGASLSAIIRHTGGQACRIGRIGLHNAFVIDRPPLRLLYVRPDYTGHRRAATKVFSQPRWKMDYDHALGRKIATSLGFNFVLIIRLSPKANRSHGRVERAEPPIRLNLCKLCFADRRIMDKWLGRRPHHMRRQNRLDPYSVGVAETFGFTLKQAGVWGYAMGVEDGPLPLAGLTPLSGQQRGVPTMSGRARFRAPRAR